MENLAVLFLSSAFVLLISFTGEAQQERMTYVKNDKNPGIAFTLSMVTPGVGQMYNDQVPLGLGVFFGTLALYGGGAALAANTGSYNFRTGRYNGGTAAIGTGMMLVGGLAHLGSMIYAPLKARQINRANGDTAFLDKKKGNEMSLGITNTGGAGLILAF